jgi:transcription antitermination factor NusG
MSSRSQICEFSSALSWGNLVEAWFAIQTRSRHEKLVASQLQNHGITTFLPLVDQVHLWSDRRKVLQLPLFSGYAFVRIVPSAESRVGVLRTQGVVSFVGGRGEGIPIPDQQIKDIQNLLANNVPCVNHPFLKLGQRVRIRGGCMDRVEGILVGHNGARRLVISVQLIQRSLAIRIEGYDIEMI